MAFQHTVCHCSKWINTSQPIKSFALVCHRNMCTPKNLLKVSQTGYNDEWVSCCWNFRFYADVLSLNFNLKFYSSHYTHLKNIFFRFSFLGWICSCPQDVTISGVFVCLFSVCWLVCVWKRLCFPIYVHSILILIQLLMCPVTYQKSFFAVFTRAKHQNSQISCLVMVRFGAGEGCERKAWGLHDKDKI